jgi:putative tryptophan/tyrosine transport system substrate-binding protein
MRRCDFIKVIGDTVAWPLAARTQQPAMPAIGFLSPAADDLRHWHEDDGVCGEM